jgi:hypothetical protein
MTSSKGVPHRNVRTFIGAKRRSLALLASLCIVCGIAGAALSGALYARSTSIAPSPSTQSTPLAPATEKPLPTQRNTASVRGAVLPVNTSLDAKVSRNGSNPTAGLSLAFDQTFNGSRLNTSIWSTCYSAIVCTNYGNGDEDEWYQRSGDVVSGGALHLVATEMPTKGKSSSGGSETFAYRSGMVTTKKSFNFTYGYVQVEAQDPGGIGTWPALWLLPKSGTWPPEVDIMENWGTTNSMQTTYHWGTAEAPQQAAQPETTRSNLVSSYHTYGVLWEPGSLTWYLDGKVIDRYKGSTVSSQPMYFLADLAIDGPAASGSSFNIRSIQIYENSHK